MSEGAKSPEGKSAAPLHTLKDPSLGYNVSDEAEKGFEKSNTSSISGQDKTIVSKMSGNLARKHNFSETMSMNKKLKGVVGLKDKFKVGVNRVIEMKNIKNAMSTLHSVYKLRKDQEILSAVRSANLGVEEEVEQINSITSEGNFMQDSYVDHEILGREILLQDEKVLIPNKSREREKSFGDVAMMASHKLRKKKEEQRNKKISDAIANAGKITSKEREHYKAMVECYDVMQARLQRREEMIREMRGHLHLDAMIRAAGHVHDQSTGDLGQDQANTEASRRKVASVLEQLNQLQTALKRGEDNQVLQLQDQLDVLHREFAKQSKIMEIMQQKMDHQVNHLEEVTAMYKR